jgi:hypothetical protein
MLQLSSKGPVHEGHVIDINPQIAFPFNIPSFDEIISIEHWIIIACKKDSSSGHRVCVIHIVMINIQI